MLFTGEEEGVGFCFGFLVVLVLGLGVIFCCLLNRLVIYIRTALNPTTEKKHIKNSAIVNKKPKIADVTVFILVTFFMKLYII